MIKGLHHIKYNYEEYLVASSDWANLKADGVTSGLIKYETYFSDGSVAEREVTYTSTGTNDEYTVFPVSDTILGNSEYVYPGTITDPAHTSTGVWSSKTVSTIDVRHGSDIGATEYYTEDTSTTNSGVTYISTEKVFMWGTQSKTVVRFSGDTSTGSSKERSLRTIGNIGLVWYTETNAVDIGVSNGRIVYDKVQKVWYQDPSGANDTNISYQQRLHLVETGVDTNQYSGYVKDFWGPGSNGNQYNISLKKRTDGSYNFKRSGWASASRSVKSDLELVLTKSKDSEDIFVNIPMGYGTFFGYYEHGIFVGVYTTTDGKNYSASVGSAGISVDGIEYKYNDL